jgi:DNA (cytosine-5)-methyltransferase 1
MLMGWRTMGYVEINDYCCRVLRKRMEEGVIYEAPIFSDITAFVDLGYSRRYRDMVDVITAGFPCKPFSLIRARARGEGRGGEDVTGEKDREDREDRDEVGDQKSNLWPITLRCIRDVEPRYVFLENVRGLATSGYLGRVLWDLTSVGYDCRWRTISAEDVGAPHRRDRIWIVGERRSGRERQEERVGEVVSHATMGGRGRREDPVGEEGSFRIKSNLWWEVEPQMGRVVDGFPGRVERIRGLGNAQVPIVAAAAWRSLIG